MKQNTNEESWEERFDHKVNELRNSYIDQKTVVGDTNPVDFGYQFLEDTGNSSQQVFSVTDWGNIKTFISQELSTQRKAIYKEVIEMVKKNKCDERKVKTFGEWETESYEDKMLVNAVLQEIITQLQNKINE